MQPDMIPLKYILWFLGGYIVLSSAANAMDEKDKTWFGFTKRFLRNLTMSAREAVQQELHVQLPDPTQASDQTLAK